MVNQDKVKKLIHQITKADYISLQGDCVECEVGWETEVEGDPENQVIYFSWMENGYAYSVIITEQGLSDAIIDDNEISCKDHEGNDTVICLWKTVPLSISL